MENESDLPVSFSFFAEYTHVSTNYEKTILTFHDSLSFPIALARPGIIHFACRKENVSYIKKVLKCRVLESNRECAKGLIECTGACGTDPPFFLTFCLQIYFQ